MACQPFTPFTPGQHLPRAGVTVLAVHLGTSASTTHYDLAEERQSCRHCGPAHGGQRGGRTGKFKPHARGDHFPGAALTVIAVQLGATSDATHYTWCPLAARAAACAIRLPAPPPPPPTPAAGSPTPTAPTCPPPASPCWPSSAGA